MVEPLVLEYVRELLPFPRDKEPTEAELALFKERCFAAFAAKMAELSDNSVVYRLTYRVKFEQVPDASTNKLVWRFEMFGQWREES